MDVDGKAIPDNRGGVTSRLYEHIRANSQMAKDYQDDYLHIVSYWLGTYQLTLNDDCRSAASARTFCTASPVMRANSSTRSSSS